MRTTQWDAYQQQLSDGKVMNRTIFLSLEEQLRNQVELIRSSKPFDAKMMADLAETLTHTANICGMHALSHAKDDGVVVDEDLRNLFLAKEQP